MGCWVVVESYGVAWCGYDFAIFDDNDNLKALVEFDGEQHFQEAGSYFNDKGQVQVHDNLKNKYALTNRIPLLRIPFTDCYKIDAILDDWLKNHIWFFQKNMI